MLGAKENDVMLEDCAPAVQYALRRLVRGLGSSREVRWFGIYSRGFCFRHCGLVLHLRWNGDVLFGLVFGFAVEL